MGNKRKKAAVVIRPDKVKEILETPDEDSFFKLVVDLDNEGIEIITISVAALKDKLRKKTDHG